MFLQNYRQVQTWSFFTSQLSVCFGRILVLWLIQWFHTYKCLNCRLKLQSPAAFLTSGLEFTSNQQLLAASRSKTWRQVDTAAVAGCVFCDIFNLLEEIVSDHSVESHRNEYSRSRSALWCLTPGFTQRTEANNARAPAVRLLELKCIFNRLVPTKMLLHRPYYGTDIHVRRVLS